MIILKKKSDLKMIEGGKLPGRKERKTIEDAKLHRAYGQLSRVKALFAYDLGCMTIIAVVGALFYFTKSLSDWEIRQMLYWSKCTYGLLSLPYLFYSLPLMHLLFQSEP